MDQSRVLLLVADRVHTLAAEADPHTDAVLLQDDRILRTGRASELKAGLDADRVLRLPGAVLTPGLTDAHIHLLEWALGRTAADLSAARSPAEAAAAVARQAGGQADDDWVRGGGWNPHSWGGGYPDREALDQAVPDRPVVLQSHDLHALWVNGAALERAGIDDATPDPADGRIVRDAGGRATGVLLEYAAQLVSRVVPPPSRSVVLDAVTDAQRALHRLGITGVHSFPNIHLRDTPPLAVLQELRAQGRLELRVLQHLALEQLEDAIALGLRSGFGEPLLRIGGIKMFLDGALGSRTAWMRAPYEDSDDVGMRVLEPQAFERHVAHAAGAGFAAVVHAIGDAAVALALDVLGRASRTALAMPHRIEHIQCCPPERSGDAGRHGIVCSVQPSHLISDWRAVDRHWGARARSAYAFASLAAGGATLAFGSDAPVEPVDPRLSLYAACTRQDLAGEPAGGWYAGERLDARTALSAFTRGPAIAAGTDDRLGRLVPGAFADVVAWDRDPLAVPAHELLAMRCVAAVVGGTLVWRDA